MGIAFSLGFIIGPLIGAVFAAWAKKSSGEWFVFPAGFALLLALADLFFFISCFKETLPSVSIAYYIFKKLLNLLINSNENRVLGETSKKCIKQFKKCKSFNQFTRLVWI